MTPDLRQALDDAYAAFAGYNAPDYLGLGGNFQLRDLSVESWQKFHAQHDMIVLMYSDDGSMFRYFLPRWLEWLSEGTLDFGSSEWEFWGLGHRLVMLGWQNWPESEIAALRQIFVIWAHEELAEYGGMPEWKHGPPTLALPNNSGEDMGLEGFRVYSSVLEFLFDAEEPAIYLELWLDVNLPQLARWLWTENWHEYKIERRWIVSSHLENELEAAFFADADGPNAELFSRSIELVRSLRAM